ncbi:NAD(P)H-binding protein [Micromonospora sp. NBC_01699]|uniref:NAD(P)-dependent oxidoreductase n=1 Tax=Micromonospora sp. NBC_01699 TaxID=2975984 RepID=UPI002E2B6878|nr:NAD(P)H-binding protein [Micromonospora sp. NBC_01699]
MKLTIVGATGGIGSQLLVQAVAAGHEVTAVVRNPARLPHDTPVRVVTADLSAAGPVDLRAAVDGSDAVLSGLGARSGAEAGVASRGTRALVRAMRATGVRRVVVVSAASVGTVPSPGRPNPPRHNPGDGFFMRHLAAPLAKAAFRRHYGDLALMEDVLRDSELDWTVSRPPRLLDRRWKRSYRTAYGQNVRAGMFIARADVAHHMLDVLDRPETFRRVIGIAY